MPFDVVRIRGSGRKILLSQHLHLEDAMVKASHRQGAVIVDERGRVVPYDH